MNNKQEVFGLLQQVADGTTAPEEALLRLRTEPIDDLGYARVDLHRSLRQGAPEVIYGAGKSAGQIVGITRSLHEHGTRNILITRIDPDKAHSIQASGIDMVYHEIADLGIAYPEEVPQRGHIVIATGGTSDQKVAEEAALTAETLGSKVTRLYDVGVSGLHRLLSETDALLHARVIIVVAGMEGALASVIGGLVDCPIVAVPTSVGYGANFGGLSALLSMLNSCAAGASVVNIDNGFGAGFLANRINLMEGIEE